MKEEKLKELLEKYYNGDASDEEEVLLREYFSGEVVFPGYEAEKDIFGYYIVIDKIVPPSDDLETRILQSVDGSGHPRKSRTARLIVLSAAALLLILIGSYFFFTTRPGVKDTYDDPQIAYIEARRILYDVSVRFNKGTMALQNFARINTATEAGLESVERSADLISGHIEIVENLGKMLKND